MCTSRGSWSEVAVDSPGYLQCPLSFSSSFLPDRVSASRYSQADFDQGGAALQPIGQNPLKLFLITSFLSVFEMGCVSCKDPATDN